MKIDEFYKGKLLDAKTTEIKGIIIDGIDGDYVIVVPCLCDKDSTDNPCHCKNGTKIIVDKSDIVGEIKTLKGKNDKQTSSFRVTNSANVVLERSQYLTNSQLKQVLNPTEEFLPGGTIGDTLLCRLFPSLCQDIPTPPTNPSEDSVLFSIPGWGKYIIGAAAALIVDAIKDKLDENCTTVTDVTVSEGSNGRKITTTKTVKTCT